MSVPRRSRKAERGNRRVNLLARSFALVGAALIATAAGIAVSTGASATALVSHKAVYDLTGIGADAAHGYAGARGTMSVVNQRTCDGWIAGQRVELFLLPTEGVEFQSVSTFASWEAASGLAFKFASEIRNDGETTERYAGSATLTEPGGPGEAVYSEPQGRRIALPAGTVFPSRHLDDILAAAASGRRSFSRTVFDGTTEDGYGEISALVLSDLKGAKKRTTLGGLAKVPGWDIRLAFFGPGATDDVPGYEMGLRLLANGVAEAITMDFVGFSVEARLDRYEAIAEPSCPR